MAASDPSIYQARDQQRHPQLPDAVARLVIILKADFYQLVRINN